MKQRCRGSSSGAEDRPSLSLFHQNSRSVAKPPAPAPIMLLLERWRRSAGALVAPPFDRRHLKMSANFSLQGSGSQCLGRQLRHAHHQHAYSLRVIGRGCTAFHALASIFPPSSPLPPIFHPHPRHRAGQGHQPCRPEAQARTLAKVVNAYPPITNAQRADLGLTVRDGTPSPIPPPATQPVVKSKGPAAGRDCCASRMKPRR